MTIQQLNRELGQIDLSLLDLILKGQIAENSIILDAGCGEGRNMTYFIGNNYPIFGIDNNSSALKMARIHARSINKDFPTERFIEAPIENMPIENEYFDFIYCISVLHFASNYDHFIMMMDRLSKTLKPGGCVMIKMETTSGIQKNIEPAGEYLYRLPDQSIRFLLTEQIIKEITDIFPLVIAGEPKVELIPGKRSTMVILFNKQ